MFGWGRQGREARRKLILDGAQAYVGRRSDRDGNSYSRYGAGR